MPTWIEALKMYYSGKTFKIPKKGSEDYDAVKKLMSGEPAAASSPSKMTDAPKKITLEELRAKHAEKKKAEQLALTKAAQAQAEKAKMRTQGGKMAAAVVKKGIVEAALKKYLAKRKAKKAENYVSPLEYHTLVNHAWKVKEMKAAYPYGVMVSKTPEGYNTWREASKADASEFFMPSKPQSKPAHPLSHYLKRVTGRFQDYEDNEGNEVLYPSSDIKAMIRGFHRGDSDDKVAKDTEYNKDDVRRVRYDWFDSVS
jgi:hypothetical protein